MLKKAFFWILGTAGTLAAVAGVTAWMTIGGDREILLVGATTDAHHQIELACETCHAAPPFASPAKALRALNKTCRSCHEAELKAAKDSHPPGKFRNPRMAAYWEKLDARFCTACHIEHRPEITRTSAVTVAADFCMACHSEGEQDVRVNRPSHAGLSFDTCASSGCHNYHDNRALYADFLIQHANQPWLAPEPVHRLSAQARAGSPKADAKLRRDEAVAPESALRDRAVLDAWAGSGHAAAGENCAACHAPDAGKAATAAELEAHWVEAPDAAVCEGCHRWQARTFARGRHGMRQHPRIAKPRDPRRGLKALGLDGWLPPAAVAGFTDPAPPRRVSVGEARPPMRAEAAHQALHCGSCHSPHSADRVEAAVEACASCHDDPHTRAYFGNPHHVLWEAEVAGEAAPGTGVSCATCHLEKIDRRGKIRVSHNQNDLLRPNSKMIRPVCLDCHGLGFSLNALADLGKIARNFEGQPETHVESIAWAVRHAADNPEEEE